VAVSHVKNVTVADGTNAGIVRPSDWNSAHYQYLTLDGNTAGQSTVSGSNIVWAGGNNITLSANGSTVSIVAAAGGAGDGGNILAAGGSTAASTGTIAFVNGSGVSWGLNGTQLTATVRTDYQSAGAYLTTAALSTHTHGSAPSITGSIGVTSNSSAWSISIPAFLTTAQPVGAYLTTARASNDAIGLNSALTANGVSATVNSSGLSLNFPAFLTTAANSTHSHGNPTLNLTNINGTTASASNGLTLSLSAIVPAQTVQPVAYSAENGSALFSTLSFPNSNGHTWSTGANGIYIASDNDTHQAYATGNTTQSSTGTIQAQSIIYNGAGIVSVGVSNGSVIISATANAGTINQTGPNIADSAATITSGTVQFSNANGVSFGLAGSTMTASVQAIPAVSMYPYPMPYMGTVTVNVGTTTTVAGGSQTTASYRVWPIVLPEPVTFNDVDLMISANTVNGTGGARGAYMFGLYTVNASSRLDSVSTFAFGWSLTQNSVTAQSHTFWRGINPAASSTGLTNSSVSITGAKRVDLYDGGASLSAGLYYGVLAHTVSSNAAAVISMNNVYVLTGHTTGISTVGGYLGQNTTATAPLYGWVGIFSSTSSTNSAHVNVLPATIHTSAITNTGGSSQQHYPVVAFYVTGV
jgi:hypothetical protein